MKPIVVDGPADVQPGEIVTIEYTVENIGEGEVPGGTIYRDWVGMSPDGTLNDETVLATVDGQAPLAPDGTYDRSVQITMPDLPDGTYRFFVVVDAEGAVYERQGEGNNLLQDDEDVAVGHPDLAPTILDAPTEAVPTSSDIVVQWSTANLGTAPTLVECRDHIYLSTDPQDLSGALMLGEAVHAAGLQPMQDSVVERTYTLSRDLLGDLFLVVVTDVNDDIYETGDEDNNTASWALTVEMEEYADLETSDVVAPTLTIDDPAEVTVSWVVTNRGTGAGQTHTWTDAVIASVDAVVGNKDDVVLGRFEHSGELAAGTAYPREETFLTPAAMTGRFHLYVVVDVDDVVFENGLEENNRAESPLVFDIMPIPYADLVVEDVAASPTALSGGTLTFEWSVKNKGIGLTNRGEWRDAVYLATDPDGRNRVRDLGTFGHIGYLAPDGGYTREASATLPQGLEGTYYVVVKTGGPYEFIYTDNNTNVSDAFGIALSPPPDLVVSDIVAPTTAEEGTAIDISWTVMNDGEGPAEGTWTDQVMLRAFGSTKTSLLG